MTIVVAFQATLYVAQSETKSVGENSGRVPALDGVRGIAVLVVLIHHVAYQSGIHKGTIVVDRIVHLVGQASWVGVDLFFVLSGFLITGILFDAKSTDSYFRTFYGRRILRIFPLYFGFLALAVLLFPVLLSPELNTEFHDTQAWYWFYISNIQVALAGWPDVPIGHFWSLAIEEQFYLLWPLVVWLLNRRQLLYVAAACFFSALVIRVTLPFDMNTLDVYVLLPTRMDTLAAGAFLALLVRGKRPSFDLHHLAKVMLWITAVAIPALFLWRKGWRIHDPVVATIGYSLIAIACTSWIAIVIDSTRRTWFQSICSNAVLMFFGRYSYGIYVFQAPIIWWLSEAGLRASSFPTLWGSFLPGFLIFGCMAVSLTLIVSVVSFHCWEMPFLKLKRFLPYSDRQVLGSSIGRHHRPTPA